MKDTSGFYKRGPDGELYYAPNFVYHKDYTLTKGDRELKLPIDGWEWYDALDKAESPLSITDVEKKKITREEGTKIDESLCPHCGQVMPLDISLDEITPIGEVK